MSNYNLKYAKKHLILLKDYNDEYSSDLKKVLSNFTENPDQNLVYEIDNIESSVPIGGYRILYHDVTIIAMLSDIFYP